MINKIKIEISELIREFKKAWIDENKQFHLSFKYMFLTVLMFFISFGIYTFLDRGLLPLVVASVMVLGSILVGGLIAIFIYIQLRKISTSIVYYIGTSIIMLSIVFTSSKAPIGNYIAIASTMLFVLSLSLVVVSLYFKLVHKRKFMKTLLNKIIIVFILVVSGSFFYYIYLTDGHKDNLQTNATETLVESNVVLADYRNNNYDVIKGIYGNEKYLDKYDFEIEESSSTASIVNLLSSWNKTRESYLEHNIYDVPLNGHFFIPEEEGKYPLVLIVHGNHEMSKDSEIGYNYLGEDLASQGYIVVSVDENFLNYSVYESKLMFSKLSSENDARAYVMIKHIQKLLDSQDDENSVFYNKIDEENIALIGHSRGGEAVSIASFFNNINYLPNTYRKRLNYGLNIKSIIGIAPTDMQYKPANRPVYLENVNYLLLHGSHDMDVYYFAGSNQYERVNYTNDEEYFKAQVYLYGANHGQFNETWTASDTSPYPGMLHNTGQLMERKAQEQIAKEVIYSFFEATLKGKEEYKEVFRNINTIDEYLPDNLYMTQYHSSEDTIIADYNEDIFLETATIDGGKISVNNISSWKEGSSRLQGKTSNIYGAYIGWNSSVSSEYKIEKEMELKESDTIFLSVADASDNIGDELIDFSIRLVDKDGKKSELGISEYSKLQNRLEINISKFSFFEKKPKAEIVFQTIELPISKFDDVDLENIVSISLVFNKTNNGTIMLKDIGVRH